VSRIRPSQLKFYGAPKEKRSPYVRALMISSSVQLDYVLPTSQNSWHVDWTDTTRAAGKKADASQVARLVTIVLVPPSSSTSEAQLRRNPLGVYVQMEPWSQSN